KPLIPTDRHTDRPELRRPDFESRIAGREIKLLVIAGTLRDVRLAIRAEQRSAGVDDRDRVVEPIAGTLIDARRQHDIEFLRQRLKSLDRRTLRDRAREREILGRMILTEVRRLKELLNQDDVGPLLRGLTDQALCGRKILLTVVRAG